MEKSKLLQFQICCARTKYLSEIYKSRTIIVGATKLFQPIRLGLESVKCQKLGTVQFK